MAKLRFSRNPKIRSTIYIVDDNEVDLKVLVQEFELRGNAEIKSFRTGESFLKDLISNPPDKKQLTIIILDNEINSVNIDAKDGIELLKTIKEINREYEVILISKNADADVVTSALHYGAVNIVKKNENVFLRLQNNIKWIHSQRDIKRKRLDMLRAILLFSLVLFLAVLAIIFTTEFFQ
jgi:DNA-binding NtrC family response regulator